MLRYYLTSKIESSGTTGVEVLYTVNINNIVDVLDACYSPTSPEDISLLHEKKSFVCSVFDKVLDTHRGKKHVQENGHDFNAQEIYKKLVTFALNQLRLELMQLRY